MPHYCLCVYVCKCVCAHVYGRVCMCVLSSKHNAASSIQWQKCGFYDQPVVNIDTASLNVVGRYLHFVTP